MKGLLSDSQSAFLRTPPGWAAVGGIPSNALAYNNEPICYDGEYILLP